MKRIKITALFIVLTIFVNLVSLVSAAEPLNEILVTDYIASGSFGGSGLMGYRNTPSVYDSNDDGATATFAPFLLNGGRYRISFYNLTYSTNSTLALLDIYVNNEFVKTVEMPHRDGEPGLIDLGEYTLPAGESSYVVMRKGEANGFIRPNCAVFELLEKDTNSKSVVEITDEAYPEFSKRELAKKDVLVPEVQEGYEKIYVKNGAVGGDGTENNPFGTIKEAQEKLKIMPKENGVAVILRGGIYALEDTLCIDESNSGTAEKPVIYTAFEGEEVTLTAGKNIPANLFEKVTEKAILDKIPSEGKENIYVTDLSKVGLSNIPPMNLRESTPYTLVMGEQRGTLARWPNEGYGKTGEIIDTGARSDSGPRKKGFVYEITDARQLRWEEAENGFLNGYWMTPYTIDYASIAEVNTDKMRIVGKDWNGLGNYGYARYFAENLLEEIDKEGEWYLDAENNKLYIYPFKGGENADVKFAASNFPVVGFTNAKNVVIKGINVEVGGNSGVQFGAESENCMFIGGRIRYVSGNGATINGKNNTVRDCDISHVGARGIIIDGGNLATLTHGNNVAENNEIHNTGTGGGQKQGITISGCGNRASNNHVYDIPTHGINGGGMDLIIEKNIIERTNMEMGDTGGLYFLNYGLGYGTKIRYNIVKDSVGLMPIPGMNGEGAQGIYIDDCTSGLEIYGNLVYNAKMSGTFIHGGRNIKIYNNMYINCAQPINVTKTGIQKSLAIGGAIWENLKKYNVTEGAYKEKYPEAAENITNTEQFGNPINNVVKNNVTFNGGLSNYEKTIDAYGGEYSGNCEFEGYPDCNMTDFYDLDYAKIHEKCPDFEPIPFDDIGTYTGGMRTSTEAIVYDNRAEEFNATYPPKGAVDVPVDLTFKWEKGVGGVRSYAVFIAGDPEFKDILYYKSTTDGECDIQLEYGKTYYWRVQATPMLEYDKRWNSNGVMSFTTVKAKDVLYGEYLGAKALVNTTEEGTAGGMYPTGSKEELSAVMNSALEAIKSEDNEKMIEINKTLSVAKKAFISKRITDKSKMTTLIYDDFENDVLGQRPAGLFFRSYSPLNVKVSKDVKNSLNKVLECRDEETSYQYGNRYFDPQEGYVEMSVSVMPAQTTGSFSVGLYETGKQTTENGTISHCPAKVVFANDMNIYAGSRKTKLMSYSANEWYDIHVKLDLKEKYYDIYINGELVKEREPLNADVKSVNQFVFDTTDGTATTAANRGGFCIDNIIVRAPEAKGANPYLMNLKLNGEDLEGFESETQIYNVDMTKEELLAANIEYETAADTKVMTWKGENGVYITVISGDYNHTYMYYLRPNN